MSAVECGPDTLCGNYPHFIARSNQAATGVPNAINARSNNRLHRTCRVVLWFTMPTCWARHQWRERLSVTMQSERKSQPQAPISPQAVQNSQPYFLITAALPHALHNLPCSAG